MSHLQELNGKLTSTPRGGERNQRILVRSNLLLEAGVRQHLHGTGRRLLDLGLDARLVRDEAAQAVQIPSTLIVGRLVALPIEPLQSREALHAESSAQVLLGIGVDFGDRDLVLGELEGAGELLVDGGEVLAVAAPWCEEFDEGGFAGLEDDIVEVAGPTC